MNDKVAEVVVAAVVCRVVAMVAWLEPTVAAVMEVVDMVQVLEVTVSILLASVSASSNPVCLHSMTNVRCPKPFCMFVCLSAS